MFGALLCAGAQAPKPEDPFVTLLEANRYPIALGSNGELTGPGADLLNSEVGKAQFLMIGEQHATAGIAEVNIAIHRQAARHGFDHSALEVGPWSTEEVEKLIRSGKGRLAAFLRQPGNGFTLPFLLWAEETALVEQAVALSAAKSPVLWGLDQEFAGSAPIMLSRLGQLAKTPAQHAAVLDLRKRAAADPTLIAMMTPADYAPLRRAFIATQSPEAARMIEELALSSTIYAPFVGRGGSGQTANDTRETYMKKNFLRHFARAERENGRPPKVFFKFGANHAMRGHSFSDVPALGNFLAEWGLSRGFSMLNLAVDCVGGEQSDPRGGNASPCKGYALDRNSPLVTRMNDAPLTLFDLRPLRAAMPKTLDPQTRKTILAFDFYIPVRNPRAATPVAAR
jgi:hypothetical protein